MIGEEACNCCHPERGEAESRDLRISLSFSVPNSGNGTACDSPAHRGRVRKPIPLLGLPVPDDKHLGQHRIMGQGDSVRSFDPSESMENAGILDVLPIFHTARLGQKILRSPQPPLCGIALGIL